MTDKYPHEQLKEIVFNRSVWTLVFITAVIIGIILTVLSIIYAAIAAAITPTTEIYLCSVGTPTTSAFGTSTSGILLMGIFLIVAGLIIYVVVVD